MAGNRDLLCFRRRRLLAVALALACGGVRAEPSPEIVAVGVFPLAPYVVAGPNGPGGILVDFYEREIAPRMGVRFRWTMPTTVARLEQNLIGGGVLFTPLLTRTPAREAGGIVFAGDVHIGFEPVIAVLPAHRLDAIATSADLAGMTIGWVQSGAIPIFLQDSRIRFDLAGGIDWERMNLEKLRAGRIHGAYFSDRHTVQHYTSQGGVRLKLLSLPAEGNLLYGAFSPAAAPELVERYRRAAREAFAKGRWEAYLKGALQGK